MSGGLSEDERERIREKLLLREECDIEMRRRKNLRLLPWLFGLLGILEALAFLSGKAVPL